MILITGAAGKTGIAVIKALSAEGQAVRALVRRWEQADIVRGAGAEEIICGDLQDQKLTQDAFQHIDAIYHICPNMNPYEIQIGEGIIQAALKGGVKRFVYHSVLHPQAEKMPHHWSKMRVEEILFESGIDYTILQPAAYMENILASWTVICKVGIYPVPYTLESRLSIVALADVAQVAAKVLTQPGFQNGIFELAGPQALSQTGVAEIIAHELGRPVQARLVDRHQWEQNARSSGMSEYAIQTLLQMFEYYEHYGLTGSDWVLSKLLGHNPTSFVEFIRREIQKSS